MLRIVERVAGVMANICLLAGLAGTVLLFLFLLFMPCRFALPA